MQILAIKDILRDKTYQIRERLELWKVEEYASILDRLPPVLVVQVDGRKYLVDGFHRLEAALSVGWVTIAAEVITGDENMAYELAVKANAKNGLPLKTKEKKAAARGMLLRFPERSDRWIAEDCGLSKNTIEAMRTELEATGQIDQFDYHKGQDGKIRPAKMPRSKSAPSLPPSGEPEDQARATVEPEPFVSPPQPDPALKKAIAYLPELRPLDRDDEKEETLPAEMSLVEALPTGARQEVGPVTIIQGDAALLRNYHLPPAHLIVTSPPYNVGVEYKTYKDRLPPEQYFKQLLLIFEQCYNALVPGGRIAVVVPAGIGRNPWIPFADEVMRILREVGFIPRARIVWDKGTSGGRMSWGSFRNPSNPSVRDTTEAILVCHKEKADLEIPAEVLRHDSEGTYSPFLENQDYFMELAQDHWLVPPESAQRVGHPAPFPIELVNRLIHFLAYPGAMILDPFAGSGTVGIAAIRNGCKAVLIDIDATYCATAYKRCSSELSVQLGDATS